MIARYTDHAANERTFLAWIRTGLAVAAFGFFLVKLNVLFDAIGGGSPLHPAAENADAFAAVAARYAGLAMVVIGIAIIGRSSAGFERTRRLSIAMRLSRCRSPARSRYFRWHSRSPW
jgi:putative membrane protein